MYRKHQTLNQNYFAQDRNGSNPHLTVYTSAIPQGSKGILTKIPTNEWMLGSEEFCFTLVFLIKMFMGLFGFLLPRKIVISL